MMKPKRSGAIPLLLVMAALAYSPAPAAAQSRAEPNVEGSRIFQALGLKAGETVAEIGAGNGSLSLEAARLVGPQGKVYTTELGDSRVQALEGTVKKSGLSQITVVAGDPMKSNLPDNCCDAIFMRNVYHHFGDPPAMNASLLKSLKPGGRLAILDFTPPPGGETDPGHRGDDNHHGITPPTLEKELKAAGFEIVSSNLQNRTVTVVARRP